jgi:hypothetical protein
MRALHDVLTKHLLEEALDPLGTIELEKPVAPLDEQRVDLYFEPRSGSDPPPPAEQLLHLGLRRRMTERRCLIEIFSETPSLREVRAGMRKQLNLHHQLCRDLAEPELPVPEQWILSPGRPDSALAALGAAPLCAEGWPGGFYRSPAACPQCIVVLGELPRNAETRLLRLCGPAEMRLVVLRELETLPRHDPARRSLLEVLVEVRYLLVQGAASEAAGTEERDLMTPQMRKAYEQWKADLIQGSVAQGEARGEARGRANAVLSVLAARGIAVSDAIQEQLRACTDLARLDRWLVRAVTARDASELVDPEAA